MDNITLDQFKTMELRVADIMSVEDIEGADRLYKLTINVGSEERTIVAGIRKFYEKEDLIGKKIVLVANLEPKVLRGITSHGMLLAASNEDKTSLTLLTADKEIPSGSRVS